MPEPGYKIHQGLYIEALPPSGTIVYDTFTGANIGTITGAVVFAQEPQLLEQVALIGLPLGYSEYKIVGYGLALGTIVGSVSGTIPPSSNAILFRLYNTVGTVGATSVVEASTGNITGQVIALEEGV